MSAAESWRPVSGTAYEVSSIGRVREGERILKQWASDQGYMLARLSGPRRVERVHRLVAQAFVPNPDDKPAVNHLDCNRANNRAENLEWCTQRENLAHSAALGRMQRDHWVGKRSPNASLSDSQVQEIRQRYAAGGTSLETLHRLYGVSKRAVGRLVRGETYANV